MGADHPSTATSIGNLAVFYADQGDFATAIPLIERALVIRLRALGADHPDTISAKQSLENIRLLTAVNAIAAIATGDETKREAVQEQLAELETKGWMLRAPVERIWAGERDAAALTHGLDAQDTALIERILALIAANEQP